MVEYEPTFCVDVTDGSQHSTDLVESLVEFYRHNGYRSADDNGAITLLWRGTKYASWWTSKMTSLETELAIEPTDSGIELRYCIVTTGQHMTDGDRQFFEREADAARDYTTGDGPLIDLRDDEAKRARQVRTEMRSTGVQAAAIVFLLVFGLGAVAHFLGWF